MKTLLYNKPSQIFFESCTQLKLGWKDFKKVKTFFPVKYFIKTLLVVALLMFCVSLQAQETLLTYKVMQGSDEIGLLQLKKNTSGSSTIIQSISEVKKRFIFLFTAFDKQEAEFQNGLLIRSYIYRIQNGSVKVNKHTTYTGNCYEVKNEKSTEKIMIAAATDNLLSIYFNEPLNINQAYSDNYQCIVNIKNMGNEEYKIQLPNGNTNYYYYENGICKKVKADYELFTVEFILL